MNAKIVNRNGMALPVALCVMAVLTLSIFAASFLTRTQRVTARYYFDGEAAISLCETAAQELMSAIECMNYPEPEREDLKAFYDALLNESCHSLETCMKLEPGPQTLECIETFSRQPAAHNPITVSIKVYFASIQPFPSQPNSPITVDPREKEGLIRFEISGQAGTAKKILNIVRRMKVVSIVHPVISRFTMFIKESPGNDSIARMNPLHQNFSELQTNMNSFKTNDGRSASPVILSNGESIDLGMNDEIDFSRYKDEITTSVNENAMVFLGGTWHVGLSQSTIKGRFSDRYLTRLAKYDVTPLIDELNNQALQSGALSDSPKKYIKRMCWQLFGMNDDWQMRNTVMPLEQTQAYRFYKIEDNTSISEMTGSFAFKLFGTIRAFSPTVVFGNVGRFYQRMATVDCSFNNFTWNEVTLPHFSNIEFEKLQNLSSLNYDSHTNRTFEGIASIFCISQGDMKAVNFLWPHYYNFMSTLQNEHIMRTFDFIATNRETGKLGEPINHNNGTDPMPSLGIITNSLEPLATSLIAPGSNPEERFLGRSMLMSDHIQKTIFKGDLSDINGFDELVVKSVIKCANQNEFEARCIIARRNGCSRVKLPGIVYVKSADFVINSPWEIERGGILVVEGNIIVNAEIKSTSDEPLTLVAGKNITLQSSSVAAYLMAPKGTLTKDPTMPGFKIKGGIMAKNLNIRDLVLGDADKIISYDKAFDTRKAKPNEPHFPRRIYLSDERRVYFGKPN